jgi:flagellar P-ring protein precursor FlgI
MVAGYGRAERIKDLASVAGRAQNQLIGYGLVVGLDGSGDQTTQTPFTVQSIVNMLSNLGVTLPPGTSLQLKNVAAVMVTASLPPFARAGQQIDVTVSSMGNAKSLRGGTLLMTPLKGADGRRLRHGPGQRAGGGAGASAGGSKVTVNHLSVGRIAAAPPSSAKCRRRWGRASSSSRTERHRLRHRPARGRGDQPRHCGPATASAEDGRRIRVRAPLGQDERVAFLGRSSRTSSCSRPRAAKVIINGRTGSMVMNQSVALDSCAVAHGNLSVSITAEPQVSQPAPSPAADRRWSPSAPRSRSSSRRAAPDECQGRRLLAEVVKALNAIGATPQDLIAILQAMKASGALRAELEII